MSFLLLINIFRSGHFTCKGHCFTGIGKIVRPVQPKAHRRHEVVGVKVSERQCGVLVAVNHVDNATVRAGERVQAGSADHDVTDPVAIDVTCVEQKRRGQHRCNKVQSKGKGGGIGIGKQTMNTTGCPNS